MNKFATCADCVHFIDDKITLENGAERHIGKCKFHLFTTKATDKPCDWFMEDKDETKCR